MFEQRQYLKDFKDFIRFLSENGYTDHVLIIGSWAEYVYYESSLLRDFYPNLETRDIDVLVKNPHKPHEKMDLLSDAVRAGYAVDVDTVTGTSRLYPLGSRFEIDFLVGQMGAGEKPVLKTNIGVTADALRHVSLLLDHSIQVEWLGYGIWVPSPEAYTIQKMIVNKDRGVKQEKDDRAIQNMLGYLFPERVAEILPELSVKERKKVREYIVCHFDYKWEKYWMVNL